MGSVATPLDVARGVLSDSRRAKGTKAFSVPRGFSDLRVLRVLRGLVFVFFVAGATSAQELPPELTKPVNDFANVVSDESRRTMEELILSLQQATGDVVIVATIDTFAPYADIREDAVKMFENRGRGIGQRGKENGVLVVMAVKDRQVRIEVGYDLEQFITDGLSGEISRLDMAPAFRRGEYGAGLLAGVSRIVERIATGRNVTLPGVRPVVRRRTAPMAGSGRSLITALFIFLIVIRAIAGQIRGGRRRRWGGGQWSGWSSGVGPFGGGRGGFGGGFGGFGGGGGGFGGFGGGRSGGGGGGAGW